MLAPKPDRGRSIRVWVSRMDPEWRFAPRGAEAEGDGLDEVGRLYFKPARPQRADLNLTIWLPESAFPLAVNSLASAWRYLQVALFDADAEQASVDWFSFHRTLHPNVAAWVQAD